MTAAGAPKERSLRQEIFTEVQALVSETVNAGEACRMVFARWSRDFRLLPEEQRANYAWDRLMALGWEALYDLYEHKVVRGLRDSVINGGWRKDDGGGVDEGADPRTRASDINRVFDVEFNCGRDKRNQMMAFGSMKRADAFNCAENYKRDGKALLSRGAVFEAIGHKLTRGRTVRETFTAREALRYLRRALGAQQGDLGI